MTQSISTQLREMNKLTFVVSIVAAFIAGLVFRIGFWGEKTKAESAQTSPAITRKVTAISLLAVTSKPIDEVMGYISKANLANGKLSESERVAELKEMLVRLPAHSTPEMRFLTESDWYKATEGPLDTEDDVRSALAKLRDAAAVRFAQKVQSAVMQYAFKNEGKPPAGGLRDLQPYLTGITFDEPLIQRYSVEKATNYPNISVGGDWVITQAALLDSDYDSRLVMGSMGYSTFTSHQISQKASPRSQP